MHTQPRHGCCHTNAQRCLGDSCSVGWENQNKDESRGILASPADRQVRMLICPSSLHSILHVSHRDRSNTGTLNTLALARHGQENKLTLRSIFLNETWEKYRWQMVIAAAITSAFALRSRELSKMKTIAFLRYSFSSFIALQSPSKYMYDGERKPK